MKTARVLALVLVAFVLSADAHARCYKCRDQACFMSEGTNSWCEGITNGCFAGGTCAGEQECGEFYCGPDDQGGELQLPLASEYQLAAVTVTHEPAALARVAANRSRAVEALGAEK